MWESRVKWSQFIGRLLSSTLLWCCFSLFLVCNFGKCINFGLGCVGSERENVVCTYSSVTISGLFIKLLKSVKFLSRHVALIDVFERDTHRQNGAWQTDLS